MRCRRGSFLLDGDSRRRSHAILLISAPSAFRSPQTAPSILIRLEHIRPQPQRAISPSRSLAAVAVRSQPLCSSDGVTGPRKSGRTDAVQRRGRREGRWRRRRRAAPGRACSTGILYHAKMRSSSSPRNVSADGGGCHGMVAGRATIIPGLRACPHREVPTPPTPGLSQCRHCVA